MENYHLYFDKPWVQVEPIELHASILEISHLGKHLYKEQNLPELHQIHQHDKFKRTHVETLRHWLWQLNLRQSNLNYNHTPITASLVKYQRLLAFEWHFYSALLFYFVMVVILDNHIVFLRNIDDRNFFCVRVSFVEVFYSMYIVPTAYTAYIIFRNGFTAHFS